MFYGLPGSGKTNLMIDGFVCASLGTCWLAGDDFDGFQTKRSPVLWIDADSGEDILHERFKASLRSHGKNVLQRDSAVLHYCSFLDPPFCTGSEGAVNEIIRRALDWKVGLIGFDNLGTVSGAADENSSQMEEVMNRLRFIAVKTRSAVVVIHHTTKQAGNADSKIRITPRGHSSIEAAIDNAFWVDMKDGLVTIRQTKCRRAPIPAFGALFEFTHRNGTHDLEIMQFIGIEPELPKDYLKAKQVIIDYMRVNGCGNQSQLIALLAKCTIGKDRAIVILRALMLCNFLKVKSGPHNAHVYMIGDAKAKIQAI